METVLENKIEKVFTKLEKKSYSNPFINQKVLDYIKNMNIDIKLIPNGFSLNGCVPLGFYNNRMCEIIFDNQYLTQEQIAHMDKLLDSWGFQPYIIIVNSNDKTILGVEKYEKIKTPDNNWVAASYTRNYMIDDPILDYLKNNNSNKRKRYDNAETFLDHIFKNGSNFETDIIDHIKTKINSKTDFIEIGKSYEARNLQNYLKTIEAMKKGIPVIYQPVLWNATNKTFGCADLIIKSSFAHNLFSSYQIYNKSFDNLYEVYDIKWSNLKINYDSDHLTDDLSVKPYKAQLWIYTEALNKMQKTIFNNKCIATKGFLIGKSYWSEKVINKKSMSNLYSHPFQELAIVDFENSNEDTNIEKTKLAIKWIKDIKNNKNLCLDPPNDPRLYPNMKNTQDNEFHSIKKQLAEKNKDLTLLYSVSKSARDLALENNIYTYDDPRLSSTILGFSPESKRAKLLDGILDINFKKNDIISFDKLTNYGNWQNASIKCYVDIETINSSLYKLSFNKPNYIFMIGLGIVINNKWTFHVFTVNDLTLDEEFRILFEFENKINELYTLNNISSVCLLEQSSNSNLARAEIPIFNWSNYENTNLKPYINISPKFIFYDMCKWFQTDEIFIKGAYDFKLKSVVNALHKLGQTDICWDNSTQLNDSSSIYNGLDAMHMAVKHYTSNYKSNNDLIKNIEYYNEIDCKSMWAIHNVLQKFI
jgi:hypothetical protein